MKKEIWKDIPGYEGYYEVSSLGNVKSKDRMICNGKRRISREIKPSINDKGYFMVSLSKNGKTKKMMLSVVVAKTFIENNFNKPEVNHKDGNKSNNHFLNLEWVTRSENMAHAFKNGLHRGYHGAENPSAKLTIEIVSEIRNKHIPYIYSNKKLAKEYGMSEHAIANITSGKSWK